MRPLALDSKSEREKATFLSFAECRKESIDWVSVVNVPPPAPDLLCTHLRYGDVAFELVSITDPLIAEINAGHNPRGETAFSTSDPSERIIRKKLKRHYESPHPIELLVYNDGLVLTPDEAIVATILPWIGSLAHPFRKVWFMGKMHASEIWTATYPARRSGASRLS